MLSSLKKFFSTVHGSIPGILTPEELYRSILTSLSSGTAVGIAILLLQALLDHAGILFPNPTVASLVTMLLTLVLDLLRRQSQGGSPTPSPAPSPSPAPQAS